MDHPRDSEPPKTPPNTFPTPSTPPTPRGKSPRVRASYDCGNSDGLGPQYWEYHNKTPNFAVSPLTGGDFKERLTTVEWADKLGYKLPSGESALAGWPDPSELKPGAKLPSTIAGIDRLLKKGDGVSKVSSGSPAISEASLAPQAVLYSGGGLQKEADQDPKPSLEESKKPQLQFGAMLPPPPRVPGGLAKISDQIPKPSSEDSSKAKPEAVAMPQHLLKGAARLQEMADVANPLQAEENRAKVFMDRLPKVQEASRRLQGQLGIHCDETWPLPRLPSEPNPFIVGINAGKIHLALENCKDFAVTTKRESSKLEFLDVAMKHHEKRVVPQAGQVPKIRLNSFEEEKKASEAEASNAITRMMAGGLEEAMKEMEDEGMSKGMSDVPSTPKSLFHSVGPTPTPTAQLSQESNADASGEEESLPASQEGSSVDTAERERREEVAELMRNPRFRGTDPYGVHEFDPSPTPESSDRSDDPFATPRWVYSENATPPAYDSDGNTVFYSVTPTDSYDDQEMRTPSHQTQSASVASDHDPTAVVPPSQGLGALSVHDSELEATQSMMDETVAVHNAQDKGKGREGSLGVGGTRSDGPQDQDRERGSETSSSVGANGSLTSQDRQKGKGKQTISDFGNAYTHDGKEHQGQTGSGSREIQVDVAASLRNHSVTFLDESQPKVKERHPVVPQPEKMHGSLTEAICNYMPLEAKPILTLTLERVDPPTASPTTRRCILLKHFEIGLDGVEGLCQGTAKIPETSETTADREARVGRIGTWKQGDGGFYRSLKSAQQKDQQYGKGYWYFFGVRFKQVGKERRLRRGGKWLLFGAPIEAVYHLDVKRSQENVTVQLGGGVDASGNDVRSFEANFKRTHTLFSRGGIAPMDVWKGGENWDDGVFQEIKAAMANNGLRVGFLYANSQTFTPYPESFPAAGKNQAEKKRKEPGPTMTDEETKAMAKSMKPKRLSEDAIGAILAMKVVNDRATQDAAARSK